MRQVAAAAMRTKLPFVSIHDMARLEAIKGMQMTDEPFYKEHWRSIEPERMSAYRSGFGWDDAAEQLYISADIAVGQSVADFGCGPGKVSVALANKVGTDGHVHAIDINAEFLNLVKKNATAAGVSDRVTTHLNDGVSLPLGDASLDRITARNAIMYVDDPVDTLTEFYRVLRPGGLAHAIDGDWYMMVAEPVAHQPWREFVEAASHACRNSDMGRKLYGSFVEAGFQDVHVAVVANADVEGRLLGMIRNMAKYAKESGTIDHDAVDHVVSQIERAHADGTYLVISPQFVVTGRKTG